MVKPSTQNLFYMLLKDVYPTITYFHLDIKFVTTLLWGKCEDEVHTLKIETWESSETPENLEVDYRGQNTLHQNVLYIIEKLL